MLFAGKKIKCELKFKDKTYTLDIERHKTINDLYNLFLEIVPYVNYPIILRLSTNQHPFEGKDFEKSNENLDNNYFNTKNDFIWFKYNIYNYRYDRFF